MERVTLRVPEEKMDEVRELIDDGEFTSKSEAIRSAIRQLTRAYNNVPRPRANKPSVDDGASIPMNRETHGGLNSRSD